MQFPRLVRIDDAILRNALGFVIPADRLTARDREESQGDHQPMPAAAERRMHPCNHWHATSRFRSRLALVTAGRSDLDEREDRAEYQSVISSLTGPRPVDLSSGHRLRLATRTQPLVDPWSMRQQVRWPRIYSLE